MDMLLKAGADLYVRSKVRPVAVPNAANVHLGCERLCEPQAGGTALHYAAMHGQMGSLRALLAAGADKNVLDEVRGVCCLFRATPRVKLRLQTGKTAEEWARETGKIAVADALRDARALATVFPDA